MIPAHPIRLQSITLLLLALAAAPMRGQAPPHAPQPDAGAIAQEIVDPSSGARWLLSRNGDRPGGPGRLVLASAPDSLEAAAFLEHHPAVGSLVPVLRAGDPLALEGHSDRVDIRLEAVALGPARLGSFLRVRVKLGGRIVRAIATGPARAMLAPDSEDRP